MVLTRSLIFAGAALLACSALAQTAAPATPPGGTNPTSTSPEPAPATVSADAAQVEGAQAVIETMNAFGEFLANQQPDQDTNGGEPMVLNARKAVELALSQNAQVLVAEDDLEAARAKIGQARSQLFPQIKASSNWVHTEFHERDRGFFAEQLYGGSSLGGIGGGMGGGGGLLSGGSNNSQIPGSRIARFVLGQVLKELIDTDSLLSTPETFRTDKVALTQVIYSGGQIKAAIRASEFLAQSQEYKQQSTLAQVEYNAKEAYYTAAASSALVRVAEASVETFERQLNDTKQMFDVGMISNFEVLRAQTELGNRKSTLVQARNGQRLAIASLRRAIGVPQSTGIKLESRLDYLPFTQNLDALVSYAYEHRPEILALKKGIEAAGQDIKRVRGQYKPTVGGTIQYQNVDEGGLTQPDGWTFGVGAQWDISTGGRRKYETIESKARKNSLTHQLKDLEAIVELDVKAAQIQIQDAMARVASERGTRTLAKEGLRLAELRFQEGAGTQTETLDAELALTSADTSLVQALRDFAVANSSLERAIGKSWVREPEAKTPMDSAETLAPAAAPAEPAKK